MSASELDVVGVCVDRAHTNGLYKERNRAKDTLGMLHTV